MSALQVIESKRDEYLSWRAGNTGPSRTCFTYAERWAGLLEARMKDSADAEKVIRKHAMATSREANEERIDGRMFKVVVFCMLGEFWVHGEALQEWYEMQCRDEDPALAFERAA